MIPETPEQKIERLMTRVRAVRSRLMALALLKSFALCFLWIALYLTAYVYLDHTWHIPSAIRLMALLVLAVSVGYLFIRLLRSVYRHASCSRVAGYIEDKIPLQQQLVAAVEYHEQQSDYPYSKTLARYLVTQVDQATTSADFKRTVPTWQGYVFSAVILAGLICASVFLVNNFGFFYRYVSRLAQPLADIAPLPETELRSITQDILTPPDQPVTFAAEILGQVPETGDLILEASPAVAALKSGNDTGTFPVYPSRDKDGAQQFKAEHSFSSGDYRYRFESGEAASEWHQVAVAPLPNIASMEVRQIPFGKKSANPTVEAVENHKVVAYKGAHVAVTAHTTTPLRKAGVIDPQGIPSEANLQTDSSFVFEFDAQEEGLFRFRLVSDREMVNEKEPGLQILLKEDQPPSIELQSPGGDYVATNVASIPIVFAAEDDFGLASGELILEIAYNPPVTIPFPIESGVLNATCTYTLELENFALDVGDSILYYVRVTDLPSEIKAEPSTTTSDIYLIEIRPYQRTWHPSRAAAMCSAMPNGPKDPGRMHDNLTAVLEYTRAILKKTWAIANEEKVTEGNRKRMDSIRSDVEYTRDQVAMIREDPKYPFSKEDIALLDGVLWHFGETNKALSDYDAKKATDPETKAYQALRKILIEVDKKICPPGAIPNTPDRLVLEESVHLTRYDVEKGKEELNRLTDELNRLQAEQRSVRRKFDYFLAEATGEEPPKQKTTDEKTWTDEDDVLGSRKGEGRGQGQGEGGTTRVVGSSYRTIEGAIGVDGRPSPPGQVLGGLANQQDRLKMIQAKEKEIQERLQELTGDLRQVESRMEPKASQDLGSSCRNAGESLSRAGGLMKTFMEEVSDIYYQAGQDGRKYSRSREALDGSLKELAQAKDTLTGAGGKNAASVEYQKQADRLVELADALDRATNPGERNAMLDTLKKAQETYQSARQSGSRAGERSQSSGQSGTGRGQKGSTGTGGPSGSQDSSAIVYDYWGWDGLEPGDVARYLAMGFRSLALSVEKKKPAWMDEPASDADFYRIEKDFFEQAAQFEP
ncbi:MAG TPA: hypothetical protein PK395_06580 [bacterium]|nr:hypothetical protein [bacterium]